jgi:antitoxin (DNA-binding transcriptional repressor) of toxin-antitoxin stability system
MNDTAPEYDDISATEFKKQFGKTLEDVAHGKAVRIIRHGRRSDSLVLMREDELVALRARTASPLDALRDQFDELLARMQTPEARRATAGIGHASTKELGTAALRGTKRGG